MKKTIKTKIELFDIDAMGVMWHGNYAKLLEIARSALLDEINYSYTKMQEDGFIYPVVKMQIKYITPIFLNDEIFVEAEILPCESLLNFSYKIKKDEKIIAKATTSQACIDIKTKTTQFILPSNLLKIIKG